MVSLMMSFAAKYSYLGVFIVSILSNMVLFLPMPYLAAILLLAATTNMNPLLLAVASGLGSGVGKLFAYFIGFFGRTFLKGRRRENLDSLAKIVGRGGMIAALVVSAIPLPDDIVLVPLGTIKYSLMKFWVATTLGKTLLALLTCYFGKTLAIFVEYVGGTPLMSALISIAIVVIGMAIVIKVDWIRIATIIDEEGLRGVAKRIRREGFKWLFT
ncbi:MAG: VTT domain-containing protein [Candidatus Nezhaarchaeales archaeon]